MADTEISLRPVLLKAAGTGANPFAMFGKGAGFTMKAKKVSQRRHGRSAPKDQPRLSLLRHTLQDASIAPPSAPEGRKRTGERLKYTRDFMMKFMEVRSHSSRRTSSWPLLRSMPMPCREVAHLIAAHCSLYTG